MHWGRRVFALRGNARLQPETRSIGADEASQLHYALAITIKKYHTYFPVILYRFGKPIAKARETKFSKFRVVVIVDLYLKSDKARPRLKSRVSGA